MTDPWYERYGGHLVALALHILLLAFMMRKVMASVAPPEEPAAVMQLSLNFPAEASAALEEMQYEAPKAAEAGGEQEEAQISPDESFEAVESEERPNEARETPKDPDPESKETETTPEEMPEPLEKFDPVEWAAERERKRQEILEQAYAEYTKKAPLPSRAKSLDELIREEELKTKGSKLLDPSVGDDLGAARKFDIRGADAIVREVLDRYEIRIVTRFVAPGESSGTYLSRAVTNDATYYPHHAPGQYEVFEISAKAQHKLKTLEYEHMKAAGFDPSRDRLVQIVFGIVPVKGGYDLGVLDLRAERLPGADPR